MNAPFGVTGVDPDEQLPQNLVDALSETIEQNRQENSQFVSEQKPPVDQLPKGQPQAPPVEQFTTQEINQSSDTQSSHPQQPNTDPDPTMKNPFIPIVMNQLKDNLPDQVHQSMKEIPQHEFCHMNLDTVLISTLLKQVSNLTEQLTQLQTLTRTQQ